MFALPRLLLALVIWLSAGALALAAPVWPQAHSDLPADPAARFGVLPNGLRYAVMRNATPAGQTSLRLRIGSGSLEEDNSQQGLAHVLEHMAFKGSTHVPANEMVRILQRRGLAFGPDTNAETEWTQTVFMLDLPRSDADNVDTGLMLLRETAGNLTLDGAALASERGVVLSEERLRDTPRYRAEKAQLALFLQGQLAADRFPIGQVSVIQSAPASLVRRFYEANYRPENATLIAVGDFDPAAMEAKIKARFSDWSPVGPAGPRPDLGVVATRGVTAKVIELPGSSTEIMIGWARPFDASPDTRAKEIHETVENLGLAVLNRRLGRLARGEHPPFLTASAGFENLFDSAKIAVIQAQSRPEAWPGALAASEREVRRLVSGGVTQAELDREIVETRTRLKAALAGAATRPTPELAGELVQAVDENEVFTSPAGDLAVFEEAVRDLTAAKVDAATRAVFAGQGPLITLATPTPVPGGDAALKAAYVRAAASSLDNATAQSAVNWPYTHFGPVGKVASRRTVDDLGLTIVRFANGVGLTVKPTHLRDDQILIAANFGLGRLALPSDRPSPTWAASAFVAGGFGKLSLEDSQRALAGKTYGVALSVGDSAFVLGGATRTVDLETQLQVMTAYFADPGFRPEAFDRVREELLTALPQMDATPDGVFGREAPALFADGDRRWAFPDRSRLTAAAPADLRALLAGPLAHGPLEITMVGDIDVDRAIDLVARTFGALPDRPASLTPPPGALKVRFPPPTREPLTLTHTGRPDQAVAAIGWPMTDFFADMGRSRAAMLAGEVFENRLLDKIRIQQGATYSPETRVDLSQTFPGYGYGFALVEIPPAKIAGFYADVASIAADLRAGGVTADELERARNPRVAGIRKAQLTNEYWLADLAGSLADPRRLDLIRSTFPDYAAVTRDDITRAARDYLTDDRAWKLVVRAATTAPTP